MRSSPITPTERMSASTAKACQIARSSPAAAISARTIASASCSSATRSRVTSPMMRTARPGPGNGWRHTISSGRPSSSPRRRTSSLNRSRSGSMSSRRMSSGSPPTLWWLLITAAVPSAPPVSMRSGYSVPCTRILAAASPASPACRPVFSSNDVQARRHDLFKYADELVADRLALRLRVGDARERGRRSGRRRRRGSARGRCCAGTSRRPRRSRAGASDRCRRTRT